MFVYELSGSGLESSCSHYKILIWYFHKFSVQDHLHEHYCTFEQFVGKTLIEIESAILNKQKMCDFVSFKTFYKRQFFTTVKGTFKNTYSCCCCCFFLKRKTNSIDSFLITSSVVCSEFTIVPLLLCTETQKCHQFGVKYF